MEQPSLKIDIPSSDLTQNDFLYRYLSIDKLLDFLINCRLTFSRLDTFEDKSEGVSLLNLVTNIIGNEIGDRTNAAWLGNVVSQTFLNTLPSQKNSIKRQGEIFRKTNYANCWYYNNCESVAMWKLYSKHDSIAIRIPYSNLSETLKSKNYKISNTKVELIAMKPVKYFRFNAGQDYSENTILESSDGFMKDNSFEHEKEYRIMITLDRRDFERNNKSQAEIERAQNSSKTITLEFNNFSEIPFEIVFHPQSEDWHRENVQEIQSKFGLKFKLNQSDLRGLFK